MIYVGFCERAIRACNGFFERDAPVVIGICQVELGAGKPIVRRRCRGRPLW